MRGTRTPLTFRVIPSPRPWRTLASLLPNLALVVAGCLLALLLAELALRLTTADSRPAGFGSYRTMDGTPLSNEAWVAHCLVQWPLPGVRHGFVPHAEWKFCYPSAWHAYFEEDGCITYRIGPHGYRRPEGLWLKPKGRFRILVIGDSVAFGVGVPAESLFSRHLERRLRSLRPNLDVVNHGVLGYLASEGVAVLVHEGPTRSPDLVIWQLHINDLVAMEGWAPPPVYLPLPESWRTLRLPRFVEHRLSVTRHICELEAQYGAKAPVVKTDERTEDFVRAVEWAGKVLAKHNLPCIAMLYPYPDYIGARYPFSGLHHIFETQCRAAGIITLDLLPWLKSIPRRDLWVHDTDNHPSPIGHRVMADALFATLQEQFGQRLERLIGE